MENRKLFKKILALFLTISLLIILTIVIFIGSLDITDRYYSFLHPLSVGTDDLGAAMFSTFWTVIIIIISFPFSAVISYRLAKKISNYFTKE